MFVKAAEHKTGADLARRGGGLLLLLLLSLSSVCQESGLWLESGVRNVIYSGLQTFGDPHWIALNDPCAGNNEESLSVAGFCGQPYNMNELTHSALAMSIPYAKHLAGFGLVHSGSNGRTFTRYAGAASLYLAPGVRAGVGLDLLHSQWSTELKAELKTKARIALRIEATTNLSVQLGLRDPYTYLRKTAGDNSTVPCIFIGFRWEVAEDFFALLETSRSPEKPMVLVGGVETKIFDHMEFFLAYNSSLRKSGIGISYNKGSWMFSAGASHHPLLGVSPSVESVFRLGTKSK